MIYSTAHVFLKVVTIYAALVVLKMPALDNFFVEGAVCPDKRLQTYNTSARFR